ncbi:hypothetical protein HYH02_010243 [Chlamydomonas schloesseri]|uniref:O-methyltransferase C-terminal domain-containing protein n=1 Tax=Chlamydomonas schloesseri TaxID=2026947 RepID=A0A835T8A9_9CHLO|nr:hypothetical protein HYH02_010243 [Chlamydomonas schloesseri]|eukprot:KAG2440664.1 hypothetical protein HYH02_010243 [Chlamydomonas schloesseri]
MAAIGADLRVNGLADLLFLSRVYKVSAAVNAAAKLDLFTVLANEFPQGATLRQLSTALGLYKPPSSPPLPPAAATAAALAAPAGAAAAAGIGAGPGPAPQASAASTEAPTGSASATGAGDDGSSATSAICAGSFRGAADWLDLLVSVGCLERRRRQEQQGEGPEKAAVVYINSATADRYLVRGRPEYSGGILCLNADRSFPMFTYLPHVLRHGALPPESKATIPDILTTFGSDVAAAEFFAEGMTGASLGNFTLLAQSFPFARYTSLGDLGGSAGCLACAVAAAHPHMAAATYDLPPVHTAAERYVRAQGCEERVQVVDYDFFSDAPVPGRHDVITLGMVLHDWGLPRKMQLLRKAYAALPPGGALIAVDHLVDDDRAASPIPLGMSLTMLLEFGAAESAFDYSYREFCGWVKEVGFTSTQLIPLVGTAKAAVAYK